MTAVETPDAVRERVTFHRFVPIHRCADYVALGWLPLPSLDGTPHGRWSVHMTWLCGCEPIEPTMVYSVLIRLIPTNTETY